MYLCYIDESGTPDIPGNSSHYILAGIAIPIWHWKTCEVEIKTIKKKYNLENAEIHCGWLIRKYIEQQKITDFDKLSHSQRRAEVNKIRNAELIALQKKGNKLYRQTKKNYRQTNPYIHLTLSERIKFVEEIASSIGGWQFARLFAECIDKLHFDPTKSTQSIDEQALEQVVSRFQSFLKITPPRLKTTDPNNETRNYGLLIHDNNETVAKKHTELMKTFHVQGTLWAKIENIIETPLFVNSELTSMIQIADVCAYGLRRYIENQEDVIFKHIFNRADRKDRIVVGVRHFTNKSTCSCTICTSHGKKN